MLTQGRDRISISIDKIISNWISSNMLLIISPWTSSISLLYLKLNVAESHISNKMFRQWLEPCGMCTMAQIMGFVDQWVH